MGNAPQKKKMLIGQMIEVPEGATITRPNGTTSTVTGGGYFADAAGTFTVGDQEFEVK